MSGILPIAQAATGSSASDAIPIGTDGKFSGIDQPSRSTWYRFSYAGNNTQTTISVTYEPADSNRMDIFVYTPTNDPNNPRKEGVASTRTNNTLTITFTDPAARDVLVSVENDHPDRTVSFVGGVTPTTALATPTAVTGGAATPTPQTTPTPGPVATSAANALTVDQTGLFVGTLTSNQAVWYRFYYGNPGANATVNVGMAPTADSTDLNLYTGTDVSSLTQQTGSATRSGNTLSRTVNLPNPQFVYLTVVNNNSTQVVAYSGSVSPAFAPPLSPTAVTTAAATAATATTPTPAATSVPAPAPQVAHDARYFTETGYRIDDDAIYAYFQGRGQVETFGFPVSRTFRFLGCQVQIFQRQVAQNCGSGSVQLMNVLDPEIFPYTRVNGSIFPGPDDALKNQTPQVGSANYATAILDFVRANAPDNFQGQPTNFMSTFFNSVSPQQAGTNDPNLLGLFDLEIWGAPISRPQPDPSNTNFIYQRFQRGIMHYTASQGTRGILLADYLKQIILGPTLPGGAPNQTLPPDLAQQAQGSKYFAQYCPGGTRWECRPNDLTDTDLTFAFERG